MRYRIFIFFLLLTHSAGAKESLLSTIIEKYKKIQTFSAEIKQTNYWKEIEVKKSFTGNIFYNSNKLIIKYYKPYKQFLYIDNQKTYLYDSKSQQLIISESQPQIKLSYILNKYFSNKNSVTEKETKKGYTLISSNKIKDKEIKKIDILIYKNDLSIKRMTIYNKNGNFTTYSYFREKINKEINDSAFKTDIPKNTSSIDMRNF